MSAGVLFTDSVADRVLYHEVKTRGSDGRLVLAGVQIKNGQKILSGFGGKSQEGETEVQTAAREVLEEIFDINPSAFLIEYVVRLIRNKPFIRTSPDWCFFVCSFQDLFEIYCLIQQPNFTYKSPEEFLAYLLLQRKPQANAEISYFCLLPAEEVPIDKGFLQDLLLAKPTPDSQIGQDNNSGQ
jgi:hypothetical protein